MGVLTALALILNFIERLFPPLMPFAPGAKIGLGNIITLVGIIILGYRDTSIIVVGRCSLGALFGGNVFGLLYSLGGGMAAFVVMSVMFRFLIGKISIISISITGAVVHNAVQTFIASIVVSQMNYFLLLPFMLAASVLAGLVVGLAAYFLVRYVPESALVGRERR
jgi:heptaprenyl diphosphate synthase